MDSYYLHADAFLLLQESTKSGGLGRREEIRRLCQEEGDQVFV